MTGLSNRNFLSKNIKEITENQKYIMEKIVITYCGSQPIICKIVKEEDFYIEGELLYPFAGVKFDYFKENEGLTTREVQVDPKPVIHGLYRIFETVVTNKGEILANAATLQKPVRSMATSLHREKDRFDYAIKALDALEIDSNNLEFLSKRAATRLTESISDSIGTGELDFVSPQAQNYESELERILDENDFVKDIDKNIILKKTIFWAENLQADANYGHIRFKTIRTPYPQFEMPKHLYGAVSEEDFLSEQEGLIPFFIGTQFGLTPRLTEEKFRKLEGQKIAIQGKSQLSGLVAGLGIYEVKNGERIQIAYFKNEQLSNEKEVFED